MAGYQYSHAQDYGGNFAPHEESEMRTTLGSPWSPDQYSHQSQSSFGSKDPLMQSSPYIGAPDTPHLQTRFSYMKEADQHELHQDYSSNRQLFRLLQRVIVRFIISTAFCAAIVGIFIFYEKKGVLDRDEKHLFNAIFLGLSLILSMNLISAFKSMASMMKWRLLATSKHTLREVDLILSLSSFQKVLELLWAWTRSSKAAYPGDEKPTLSKRWIFRTGAVAWILLGLAAQVDVALVGLTFNHESEGAIAYMTGPVNVTQLEYIYADYPLDRVPTLSEQKYAAHMYGLMNTNVFYQDYEAGVPLTALLQHGPFNTWTYYFREWATASGNANSMVYTTNRSVTVDSECQWAEITGVNYGGNNSLVELTSDSTTQTIDWLKSSEPNSTIMVAPIWDAMDQNSLSCGPRCNRIYIFNFLGSGGVDGYGDFFNCTVTISGVRNADPAQKAHQLPDDIAYIIAGSAGSEGWKDSSGRQYSKYSPTVVWGSWNGYGVDGEDAAAWTVGKFAIGAIAAYDQNGPMIEVIGTQSWIGVILVVKWLNLYISLGVILAIQLILGIFVAFKANSVYCKDDSYLSTSRLLRPLMERLGSSGSVCDGKKLATTFTRKVVYGVRTAPNGIHHLDIGEDIPTLEGKFPSGQYD